MKALVIGANGFLGRHICRECLKHSWRVDALYHKNKDKIPKRVKMYTVSQLENLSKDYDVIFLTVGNFASSTGELLETNVALTQKVANKFIDSRIVFVSSTAVYGLHKNRINLSSSFNQPNDYGLSKLAGEFVLKVHKKASIIRFTALYGPGMNSNLFISKIIEGARREKVIKIFGDGKRKQDYLYVKDAASLCFLVANHKKVDKYLGAYGKSFSNNQIAQIVKSYFPDTAIIHEGKDESPSFVFDVSDTKKELAFSPLHSPREGIKEMIELYE